MLITIDIGNANIVLCGASAGKSVFRCSIASSRSRTADEYSVLFSLLAEKHGVELTAGIEGAIIASVVPQLTPVIRDAVKLCTGKNAIVIGPGVKSGLNIRIDDPSELGADLVAAAVGALNRYPLPCITIDMNTATAIGVIDSGGSYIGGLICPGVMISQLGLEKGASRLPSVSLEAPRKVIGKTTADGMRSGIIYGAAAMIDGVIDRIQAELDSAASVVATGDWAESIVPYCLHSDIIIDRDLVMRGLESIYRRNFG